MGVQLSFGRSIQTLVAVAFGLGVLAFGIADFAHIDRSERRIEAKLRSIRAGVIQPDTLTAFADITSRMVTSFPRVTDEPRERANGFLSALASWWEERH
jgi:hypothetical protein